MKTIHIVDYGTGNTGSLLAIIEALGWYADISHQADQIESSDVVILPGVGNAGIALNRLRHYGVDEALQKRFALGRPVVGICLGAQLMGGFLHEANARGFGWLNGDVTPIIQYPYYNNGWCRLDYDALQQAGLSRALTSANTFFFNHRYAMGMDPRKMVTVYQRPEIPAIYLDDVVCAIQFHPEKSQDSGRILLRNVIEDHYGL